MQSLQIIQHIFFNGNLLPCLKVDLMKSFWIHDKFWCEKFIGKLQLEQQMGEMIQQIYERCCDNSFHYNE